SAGFPAGHPPMTSFLGVPIRHQDRSLGRIYLTDKLTGGGFTEDDQQIIEMMAAYAGVAIANARLYKRLVQRDRLLTRRNENLALLNDLASTLATSSDIDQILDRSLSQIMEYLQLDVGEIYLRPEDSRTINLALHRGPEVSSLWHCTQFRLGEGVVGSTAKDGQPRLIALKNPNGHESDLHPCLQESDLNQVACLPLNGRRGVIGVLCIGSSHPRPLDELELQFLSTISSWVGTAIENLRLSMQGRRLAILEERQRIGMDLHDGIIQSIYAVGLTLEHARLLMSEDPSASRQRIDQAVDDLNKTIRDIRAYILDLRPRQFRDETLIEGIQRLVQEFRANTLLNVNLQGPPGDLGLAEAPAIALFHICQEALANIAKHARAQTVDVLLWKANDRVLLEIHDDGRGFDMEKVKLTIGHGLSNMQTRAFNVGGEVEITSEPGQGTTVLAWVPFTNEN
ncbi:MAG TPA: GAF domain-containing sensor histidine kinase, partial [Anaerolineaceae bacterium]|nr:GAF domain-containing sensor histidine kinase [Anaerolineaceae bacterium]